MIRKGHYYDVYNDQMYSIRETILCCFSLGSQGSANRLADIKPPWQEGRTAETWRHITDICDIARENGILLAIIGLINTKNDKRQNGRTAERQKHGDMCDIAGEWQNIGFSLAQ